MLRVFLLFLILFLNGCGFTSLIRAEFAGGSPFAAGKIINDDTKGFRSNGQPKAGLPMSGGYSSIKYGLQRNLSEEFSLSFSVGPAIFIPFKEPWGKYYSIDLSPRLTFKGLDRIFFYLEGLTGIGWLEHRWPGEATKHQFTTGGGLGVVLPIDTNWHLDFGYRIYHISNGSAIFGTKRPNVGYNTDFFLFGINYNF